MKKRLIYLPGLKVMVATLLILCKNQKTRDTDTPPIKDNLRKTKRAGELAAVDPIIGNMRYVPPTGPGGFVQGSPLSEPAHWKEAQFTHILTRYLAVMETEVTRRMWAELKARQPNLPPDPTNTDRGGGENNPVQCVSWHMALYFANVLSLQNGLKPCYYKDKTYITLIDTLESGPVFWDVKADGYRLPSEGEWEYFTRAGTTGPFSIDEPSFSEQTFYEGTEEDLPRLAEVAVFNPRESGQSWPVASLRPNPWNLFDVHGNVWEWVWDRHDYYPKGTQTDYAGPEVSSLGIPDRSMRGGSWAAIGAKWVRSAARAHGLPGNLETGFRLVRTLKKGP